MLYKFLFKDVLNIQIYIYIYGHPSGDKEVGGRDVRALMGSHGLQSLYCSRAKCCRRCFYSWKDLIIVF